MCDIKSRKQSLFNDPVDSQDGHRFVWEDLTPGPRVPQGSPLLAAHHLSLPVLMVGTAGPGSPHGPRTAFPPSAPRGPGCSLGVSSVMHVNSRNVCVDLILNLMVKRKTDLPRTGYNKAKN